MLLTVQRFSVDSDLKMNGRTVGTKQQQSAVAELQSVIHTIPGTALTIKFTPQGKVLNVTGGDRLIGRTNALKGKLNWINAQSCNMLLRNFTSRDRLKELSRYKLGEMGHPLAVGESVSYSPPLPPSPKFTQRSSGTMTLKSRVNGRAFFTVREVYSSHALKTAPPSSGPSSHVDSTGSIIVEESSDLLVSMDHVSRTKSLILQPMKKRAPLPISASVLAESHFTTKRLARNFVN